MEDLIDGKRRIEAVVCRDENSPGEASFLFDRNGCLLDFRGAVPCSEAFADMLSGICRNKPLVSGREYVEAIWEGRPYHVCLNRYIHLTLGELADIQARRFPDREAVVDSLAGVRLTYREVKRRSDGLAKGLMHIGILKGDHVAVIMDNCWENVVTKIAIEKTGAVIVNLNIHEKKDMLECLLHRADVKAVILKQGIKNREHMDMFYQISPELKEAVPGRIYAPRLPLLRHVIVTDQERPRSCAWQFEKLMELGMSMGDSLLKERMKAVRPFDDATIIHTSGTSGVPKGVMLNHCQILENAWIHVQYLGLEKEDRLCMTPPMFHSFGCVGSVLSSMMAGAALVCYEKTDRICLLEMLRKERCTVLCSVPTVYIRLIREMREGKAGRKDLCLRLCVTAGAPCPEHTLRDMKRVMGAEAAVVMYGMTEAGPGISSTSMDDSLETAVSTVGRLWPGVTGRIQDLTTGRVLGPGRAGELCIKSYGVMKGYYNNPEETEKAVDREGWLHTGDIASLSEDGLLTLKGRCKDLIIRGGENISPREIEDFIRNYEPVEDVAVVGAPDEQYGELVYAFIRPKEGAVVTKEGLRNWCRGKIATIKIPQEIELTDHFPISATGKISKGQLRSLAREHLEERGTRQTEPETGEGGLRQTETEELRQAETGTGELRQAETGTGELRQAETESGGLRRSDRETAVSGQRAGETGKDGRDTWQKS